MPTLLARTTDTPPRDAVEFLCAGCVENAPRDVEVGPLRAGEACGRCHRVVRPLAASEAHGEWLVDGGRWADIGARYRRSWACDFPAAVRAMHDGKACVEELLCVPGVAEAIVLVLVVTLHGAQAVPTFTCPGCGRLTTGPVCPACSAEAVLTFDECGGCGRFFSAADLFEGGCPDCCDAAFGEPDGPCCNDFHCDCGGSGAVNHPGVR